MKNFTRTDVNALTLSLGVVRIINRALYKILVDPTDEVMGLASHVVAIRSKGTNMLAHLLQRF